LDGLLLSASDAILEMEVSKILVWEAFMRLNDAFMLLVVMLLFFCNIGAQEKTEREIDIHKNVRLIIVAIPQEMPEELKDRYQKFLPLFEEALTENTSEQALENALTFRVVPAIKEIGSAKTKRAIARLTAYRKDSKKEFFSDLLIHSYATGKTVNKEEIGQFIKWYILNPLGLSQTAANK
jgi:hypothetical protein